MSHSSAGGRPLDLAACNNPRGWAVPPLPDEVWRLAPDDDDGFELDAVHYYGNADLLPVAGRHAAINLLPHLFPPAMVACIGPLEDEHALAWKAAGHRPRLLQNATLARAVGAATPFVLLANPNPITGSHLLRENLLDAASQLGKRGGWLIVDETLADPLPDQSVAAVAGMAEAPRLIVLRSLAEFFGLAGAPVAFLLASPDLLARLKSLRGPRTIPGPSRAVARMALADAAWQAEARRQLAAATDRLHQLLAPFGEVRSTALFAALSTPQAADLHNHLARNDILVHFFEQGPLLRFGLPGGEAGWQRLATALAAWRSA